MTCYLGRRPDTLSTRGMSSSSRSQSRVSESEEIRPPQLVDARPILHDTNSLPASLSAVFCVAEYKVRDALRGLAQAVCYLSQLNEMSGTRLGFVFHNIRFGRLVAIRHSLIAVEVQDLSRRPGTEKDGTSEGRAKRRRTASGHDEHYAGEILSFDKIKSSLAKRVGRSLAREEQQESTGHYPEHDRITLGALVRFIYLAKDIISAIEINENSFDSQALNRTAYRVIQHEFSKWYGNSGQEDRDSSRSLANFAGLDAEETRSKLAGPICLDSDWERRRQPSSSQAQDSAGGAGKDRQDGTDTQWETLVRLARPGSQRQTTTGTPSEVQSP